jgi:hypothetical protein
MVGSGIDDTAVESVLVLAITTGCTWADGVAGVVSPALGSVRSRARFGSEVAGRGAGREAGLSMTW